MLFRLSMRLPGRIRIAKSKGGRYASQDGHQERFRQGLPRESIGKHSGYLSESHVGRRGTIWTCARVLRGGGNEGKEGRDRIQDGHYGTFLQRSVATLPLLFALLGEEIRGAIREWCDHHL